NPLASPEIINVKKLMRNMIEPSIKYLVLYFIISFHAIFNGHTVLYLSDLYNTVCTKNAAKLSNSMTPPPIYAINVTTSGSPSDATLLMNIPSINPVVPMIAVHTWNFDNALYFTSNA